MALRQLDTDGLAQHVTILGWLHIAWECLGLLIGAFFFFLLSGIGVVSGDPDAARILPTIAVFVGGFIGVLSIPGLLAGYGLLKRKSWARVLALVVGFLDLLVLPIGTVLGIYTFWVLLQEGAQEYFDG